MSGSRDRPPPRPPILPDPAPVADEHGYVHPRAYPAQPYPEFAPGRPPPAPYTTQHHASGAPTSAPDPLGIPPYATPQGHPAPHELMHPGQLGPGPGIDPRLAREPTDPGYGDAPYPYPTAAGAPLQGSAPYAPHDQGGEPPPPLAPPGRPQSAELQAPARQGKEPRLQASAPIVPAGSVTGRSLTLVIIIMCFLACLTAGAVYMINQSASAWLRDIASEVTVQIEPRVDVNTDKLVTEVALFLSGQQGVRTVRALTEEESSRLLEPWLRQTEALKALPVPRLIALEIDRVTPASIDRLNRELEQRFKKVAIDDHRHWQKQIQTVTRSFALGGLGILLLVAAATTAIIVSATKSAMASNREIVEVLHFVGATDRFIAREFSRHFLRLGIRAGLVGAGCAMLVFLLMPAAMEALGGGAVTMAEIRRLVGVTTLDPPGYLLLGLVVVVIAALCMFTCRIGVSRILNNKP